MPAVWTRELAILAKEHRPSERIFSTIAYTRTDITAGSDIIRLPWIPVAVTRPCTKISRRGYSARRPAVTPTAFAPAAVHTFTVATAEQTIGAILASNVTLL